MKGNRVDIPEPTPSSHRTLKDFAALWVYLMLGSNVNYYVMGGDV